MSSGGSPGQMDAFTPSPLRNVVINEILPHSENPAVPQFIELYNHSTNSVDVSGCILTDDPTTNKFVIPAGTVIGPAGFVSFTAIAIRLHAQRRGRDALFHQAGRQPGAGRGAIRGAGGRRFLWPLAGRGE